jgi:hypothetical protein
MLARVWKIIAANGVAADVLPDAAAAHRPAHGAL